MKNLLAILIFLLGIGSAFAQPPGTHPSYVSIQVKDDSLDRPPSKRSICGGVVADEERKLVATSWHCVPNSRPLVEAPDTFTMNDMRARLITIHPESDIAIFQVEDLKGVKAPRFATPQKGDIVTASAFYDSLPVLPAMQDRYMPNLTISTVLDWEGKVLVVETAVQHELLNFQKITQTDIKWIITAGAMAQGFSGGPAFNKTGEFIGLISGGNAGFTSISSSENLTKLLKEIKLP